MNKYPFNVIGIMRDLDPPDTGYYYYPATGEIVPVKRYNPSYSEALQDLLDLGVEYPNE